MKIIHCADVHLDSKMQTHLDPETAKKRRTEITDTFLRMIDYAKDNGVRAILIAGDLFDKRQVTKNVRNAVLGSIKAAPEIGFYYIKGNHDYGGFDDVESELPDNLHGFGEDWTAYSLDESGRRHIILYGAELGRENSQKLHESMYVKQEDINIVMMHGQLSRYLQNDKTEIVALDRLKNKGIDYLALGHVHAYTEGELDKRGNWCYPGCLEGRGFDECGKHGFVLLDIDTESGMIKRDFVEFAGRTLHELRVDLTGLSDTAEISEAVRGCWEKAGIPEKDMVKLILTGEMPGGCTTDPDLLEQRYKDKAFFLKVEDRTAEALDTGSIAEEKTLRGAYVRLVMGDDSLSEEERKELLRTGLLALSGEWERLEGGIVSEE